MGGIKRNILLLEDSTQTFRRREPHGGQSGGLRNVHQNVETPPALSFPLRFSPHAPPLAAVVCGGLAAEELREDHCGVAGGDINIPLFVPIERREAAAGLLGLDGA